MSEAFDKLHRDIKEFVWDADWYRLRPIQSRSIEVILETDQDLLISAPTASGKTEAAFMPVLSQIVENPHESVRALYIGPLKALINDQFRRLETDICRHADIPVHRWHGDVSSSKKKKLVERPSGVLLITPESIESLFVNRTRYLDRLFAATDFVVIDEMHSFMGTERGAHLRSLLSRLDRLAAEPARRIGLSATIGDEIQKPSEWLSRGPDSEVALVEAQESGELQVIVHGYEQLPADLDAEVDLSEQDLDDAKDVAEDIFRTMRGQKNLIFGNAKAELEDFTDKLQELCRTHRVPEEFFIHHGSLDKSLRENAEAHMQSDQPGTTLCTNTLELGIDVGLIDTVGQFDPPWTVSSLAQRVGRSGRQEGHPSRLRFFIQEEAPLSEGDLVKRLYPQLLQSVAMVNLFALEQWCEPLRQKRHFSTLVQQILSVLKETGGIEAKDLYSRLVVSGPFQDVEPGEFGDLLRRMANEELVEQIPESHDLILGTGGERIVNHYEFYAAFQTPEHFDVRHGSDRIGEVRPSGITEGDHIILAGRRWEVEAVRTREEEILVFPTSGRKPPLFLSGGFGEVHRRIREEMHKVLFDGSPTFLDRKGRTILESAQRTAREAGLEHRRLIEHGPHTWVFHWTGDRIFRTVRALASMEGYEVENDPFNLTLDIRDTGAQEVKRLLREVASQPTNDVELAETMKDDLKEVEKYDQYLPKFLLNRGFGHNYLDCSGAADWAESLLEQIETQ
jgi:ATP-dependent Lhr-like helicase